MARRPVVDDTEELLSGEASGSMSASLSTSDWEASTSEAEQPSTSSSFRPDSLEEDASSSSASLGPETSETSASRAVGMTSQDGSLFDFHSSEEEEEEGEEEGTDALGARLGEMSIGEASSRQEDDEHPASSSFNDSLEAQRHAIRGRRNQGGPAPRESTPALNLIESKDNGEKKSKKVTIAAEAQRKPAKSRKVVRGPNGKPIFIFTEGNKTRVVGAPSWLIEGDHLDDLSEIDWKWSDEEDDDEDDSEP